MICVANPEVLFGKYFTFDTTSTFLKGPTVTSFSGSTIRYAQKRKAQVIVKGLRSLDDFEPEPDNYKNIYRWAKSDT